MCKVLEDSQSQSLICITHAWAVVKVNSPLQFLESKVWQVQGNSEAQVIQLREIPHCANFSAIGPNC